jgi:hypothetical protein
LVLNKVFLYSPPSADASKLFEDIEANQENASNYYSSDNNITLLFQKERFQIQSSNF